jgi:hypothetical protein
MLVQLCGKVYRTSFRPKPTVPRCRCTQLMTDRLVAGLTTVVIYQRSAIRYAVTGRTLFIAPGSITDQANPGAAEQLHPRSQPALHQVVSDNKAFLRDLKQEH